MAKLIIGTGMYFVGFLILIITTIAFVGGGSVVLFLSLGWLLIAIFVCYMMSKKFEFVVFENKVLKSSIVCLFLGIFSGAVIAVTGSPLTILLGFVMFIASTVSFFLFK